jgi:type I restriction enzyme S subunit
MTVLTADWKEVRLGEHAAFFKGNGLSKSQLIDDGPQQCVHYGELFTHYGPVIETVTSKCVAFEGSFKSLAGDVLMPGSDVTPRGLATASAIKFSDVLLGGDVIVIRTKPTSLYGPFLSNFIRMSKGQVLRLVKGSTVYHIHAKDLADLEVLMPPLKEQEAIAEALSDADSAIESLDALIAKKRDVKQATMQQLLTGRTRLPGFTADWKEVRLGEHAAFFKGNGLSKSQLIDDGPQQCVHYGELFTHYGPVIETVTSKCVAFEGSFKSLAGDVLMPGSDVTPRGLATASAIKFSDVLLGGDVIVIRTKPTSLYGPFLSNFIRMSKGQVLRLVKGSTVYHIHAKDLADLEVLMPPLKEQEAIAEALTVMDDELEVLTAQVSKLRMVKEGMMQDLLTGKVRLV